MANEHIGRLQKIGLGKETTSGTAAAVTDWIPKATGVFKPIYETKADEAAFGVIDGTKEVHTVKQHTEITIGGEPRDTWFGNILLAAFGLEYPCVAHPIPGSITGTFVEGEVVTESTSSATGTLRRLDAGGSSKVLYIEPLTGTFAGNGKTLTGGTSGATAVNGVIESPSAVRYHVNRRKNDNNHPAFTIYNNDPLEDTRAAYCMLDSLEIEAVAGEFLKFTAKFMGKSFSSTSAQSPSYPTTQYAFLGKNASLKLASAFTGLDAATATAVKRFKIVISKNLADFTALGSTSPVSFHNQRYDVKGDFTLLYNATTQRDYLTNSTKQAMRFAVTYPTTIGTAANPTFQVDIPSAAFTNFDPTDANDTLREQTLGFTAEYDVTRAMTAEALLVNTKVVGY